MATLQIDKTLTALAGEFLVAGQLCLKGYVASLTFKNYPKVDIFYLNPQNNKHSAIQVKTIRHGDAYYISEDVDDSEHPFVFVQIKEDDSVEFFVALAKDVVKLSAKERNDYMKKHPNVKRGQPRMIGVKNLGGFKDRWDVLTLR